MKISIVGAGTVGVTLAYTLLLQHRVREILLVGRNRAKVEAEAADLMHAQAFCETPMLIRAGGVEDVEGSEIVVVCASAPHPQPFNDRRSLTLANAELMRSLLPEIAKAAPQAKLIMVSNPVDSLTWLALELTGFPPQRVVGTGTLVDSFRYRDLLSKEIGIHPGDLRVYILGEHGESQFPAMSIAIAGGERIRDDPERRSLAQRAKQAGLEVFQGKGNTCYAIAQATALIIRAILQGSICVSALSNQTPIPVESIFHDGKEISRCWHSLRLNGKNRELFLGRPIRGCSSGDRGRWPTARRAS